MPVFHIESGSQIAYGIGSANSHEKKYRYRKDKSTGELIENPDPADSVNTLIKMANKRAFVDATLKATGASRMFTQDAEDFAAMTGQYPKPSSGQLGFIKKLFGGAPDSEALAEISGICGRGITGWDDIRRSEASRLIDAKKSGGGNGGGASAYPRDGGNNGAALQCADCGADITGAESNFSRSKYGRPLCRKCQDIAKASR
ncbi:MAG: hypothetical protein LBK23_03380 [Oscillospiraceae bacterium]|nr:hypothetical protein [Oscillospiraceae bacterium]